MKTLIRYFSILLFGLQCGAVIAGDSIQSEFLRLSGRIVINDVELSQPVIVMPLGSTDASSIEVSEKSNPGVYRFDILPTVRGDEVELYVRVLETGGRKSNIVDTATLHGTMGAEISLVSRGITFAITPTLTSRNELQGAMNEY